jgi:hypothetical protein
MGLLSDLHNRLQGPRAIFPSLKCATDSILRGLRRPFCGLHRNLFLTPLPFAPECRRLLSHFLSDVPGSMAGGLRTPYKTAHGLKFGLEVSERILTTSAVVSARCLFCVKVGRTTANNSSRKRARTENVHYYRVPFRTDKMKTHAEKQHPDDFEVYSSLGVIEKNSYFDDVKRKIHFMHTSTERSR